MPKIAESAERGPPPSRYRYEDVMLEIRAVLNTKGRGAQKQAANAAGLTEAQFSKRLKATWSVGERFRLEHLGAVADWAGAPRGWPLVPWGQAEELERQAVKKRGVRR